METTVGCSTETLRQSVLQTFRLARESVLAEMQPDSVCISTYQRETDIAILLKRLDKLSATELEYIKTVLPGTLNCLVNVTGAWINDLPQCTWVHITLQLP
jgi:hypothetical protein